MKNTPILILLGCLVASLSAQISANLGGHGRFQTFHTSDATFPNSIDYTSGTVNWGNGTPTFGVGTEDVFTYSQIAQFNVTSLVGQTAFNNAIESEISLIDAPTNISFVLYASTVQLRDIEFNGAALTDIVSDVSGSGAVRRWFEDQRPYATDSPMASQKALL